MSGIKTKVPSSWELVKLGDFVESQKGKKPKNEAKNESSSHPIPYVDIQAFEEKIVRTWTDGVGCHPCYESDFLMVWDGSRSGLVGKGMNGALGSTLVRINFPMMVNDYAYYFLQSKYQQINTRAKGSGTPHVDPDLLWNYDFPIPPLAEQHRIVQKIEELFSELESGIDNLKLAQVQLKVYRQALLKDAFEGKLTAQWREKILGNIETAFELKKRIRLEAIDLYQREFSLWKSSAKVRRKPRPLKFPPELVLEERQKLCNLPDCWSFEKLGELFKVYVGSTPSRKSADFWGGSIPWISSGEVSFCSINDTKEKITQRGYESISAHIHPPGTLMLAMIGEGKTRGQVAILGVEASHNQNTAAIRVAGSGVPPLYLYHYLTYCYENTRKLGSGNNQKALNMDRVENLIFPLTSIREMEEVVQIIDQKLSIIEAFDGNIKTAINCSESLRQAILQKAFSGKLVPQDPNDEPASKLLSRIKAEVSKSKLSKKKKVQ